MTDAPPRLLILGSSRRETLDFAVMAASGGWSKVDSASLEHPGAFFSQVRLAAKDPAGVFVQSLGRVPSYLAAAVLPRTATIIATGVGESEFFWNRWLCQRVSAFWEKPVPIPAPSPIDAGEFPIWGFGDWTSRSGVREILWAFTMLRIAGWKCRLHLFGRGPWRETLRDFADLASTGPQIEFHPCFPDQLAGRCLPALVFSPQPRNVPDWLVESLGVTEILTSAKSPAMQSAQPPLRLVPLAWKPSAMAVAAMKILSHCRETGFNLTRQVPESIRWDRAACYGEIRRHLSRIGA